jgi:hypothetical protein
VSSIESLLGDLAAALTGEKKLAAEAKPDNPAAEVIAANQRVRDTAKWILTSFAAVGAILVGGLQLSSIGNLTAETPNARIWATLVGIFAATIGVALAIGFMSSVLQPQLRSFGQADKDPDTASDALAEPLRMTYPELKAKLNEKDNAVDDTQEKYGPTSSEHRDALASREKWEQTRQDALTLIGSEFLWKRYKRARGAVVLAIFLVLGGVVAFAWGANPPDDAKEEPAVTLGQAPLSLNVHLLPAGVAALAKARGCETADLAVLSVAGTAAEREVVTLPTARCKTVRFVLTPGLGTAVAATPP